MASAKLAAAALAFVLLCAAATASRPYRPEPESCKKQAEYFTNCLRLGWDEKCCGEAHVVADSKCFCEVEREAQIQCAHGPRCVGTPRIIKIAEMNLSCMQPKNLKCKRA